MSGVNVLAGAHHFVANNEVLSVPPLFLLDSSHSSGIRWSKIWQEGLLIFSFWCILILTEFGHSGIETGMVPRLARMECNRNPVVCLIAVCLAIVCLSIPFIHMTKHGDNTLSSHHHPPSSPSPLFFTATTCHEHPPWAKRRVGPHIDCHATHPDSATTPTWQRCATSQPQQRRHPPMMAIINNANTSPVTNTPRR